MRTYCLACRKHINNVDSRKTIMIKAAIRDKSKCAICNKKVKSYETKSQQKKWSVIL